MSLSQSQTPKPDVTEQTVQPSPAQESNQLAGSAYITSDYQKVSTNRDFAHETETKVDSSSPDRHFNSSRYSVDDKQPYSGFSTGGLTSNIGSAALNYQYSSKDFTQPSTYGNYSYQPSSKIENSGPVAQSYSYSSYKRESTSPTIKALNENTATLLGRSAAYDSNFGKTSLTLQEKYGLAPENKTLSFGTSNYSTDLKNLGLGKEEYKTSMTTENKHASQDASPSANLKYSDYLKSKPTTFEYGKSPYETTFGSTANAGGIEGSSSSLYKNYTIQEKTSSDHEEAKKSGLQSKGLYSSTDYTDLINKISNKNESKNDNYTIMKPESLNNTEKKQRPTHGSHYYQSTYPNTVRTPSESGKKDRYATSEISGVMSPPFKRDRVEVDRHSEVVDDYVISEPHITKKTLYTIENAASISLNGGKDLVNQIGLQRTPERRIKTKSGSPSPFDDLKHALKNDSVQISKIVIETVENYGGEGEIYEPTAVAHNKHGSEKFDIVMEQQASLHNRNHSRTESIKSPSNIKVQRNLVEDSSSFKDPRHLHGKEHQLHSRKHSDTSSSKVGGTITAINERIKDLDHYLSQGTRSASKQSNLVSPNPKAESSGVHHRVHHHEEKSSVNDLREKEKQEKEKHEKEKQEKEGAKVEKEKEKEREKKEKEEAKLKAKQAAALAKEANKGNQSNGHVIVKSIIVFIILLLLGVLSFELIMGAEEYDALLDTPLDKVLQ